MNQGPLYIRNCEVTDLSAVPRLDITGFCSELSHQITSHGRISAYFGYFDKNEVSLTAVVARPSHGNYAVFSCGAQKVMPSLANEFPQLSLFEREIGEQFGITFEGHPWFKPVRFSAPFTNATPVFTQQIGDIRYFAVAGEDIHEVAVGPVHAGVIEPGHFRFQCHGENVFHLEISLGYQHRGVEQLLLQGLHLNSRYVIESCAGDTTIGHTTAYCHLLEALTSCDTPPRAHALRGLALELERCANHIGDIGALSGDVGFLPTASYCGRIRGDALNMTAVLCGNRFGRSLVREGGVTYDLDDKNIDLLKKQVETLRKDFTNSADLLWNVPSVLARFENTGVVSREQCKILGLVGVAARACGMIADSRQDFPSGIYQFSHIPIITHSQGDVFARAFVRYGEVLHSLDFIAEQLGNLPPGPIHAACGPRAKNNLVISVCEGWRGEICHVGITDGNGSLLRYKIVDPSFHNWSGLALALQNQQISDFPLCNKSFNLSYSGFDL